MQSSAKQLKPIQRCKEQLYSLRKEASNEIKRRRMVQFFTSTQFRHGRPSLNRMQALMLKYRLQLQKEVKMEQRRPFIFRWFRSFQSGLVRTLHRVNYRVFMLATLAPTLYFGYAIFWQLYNTKQREGRFGFSQLPPPSITEQIKTYTNGLVQDVLSDKQVEKDGVQFLSRLLTEPHTHEAAVILLKNVLKDPRFIAEANIFGVNLIATIVRTPDIQEDFKQLVISTLQQEDVKRETVEVLRYIVGRGEAEDILALYFKTVFLRDDMLKGVTGLLTKSAVEVLETPAIKEKFGRFAVQVASTPEVKSQLYQNFIFKPAKNLFRIPYFSRKDEPLPAKPVADQNGAVKK